MARFWAVVVFIAVVVGGAMGNTHAECDACTFLVDVAAPFVENSDGNPIYLFIFLLGWMFSESFDVLVRRQGHEVITL